MRQLVYTMFITNNHTLFHLLWGKIWWNLRESQYILTMIAGTKFQLKLTILNFWTKLTRKSIFNWKKKKWKSLWILHIQISLGLKYQLQKTILIFWNTFPEKWKRSVKNKTNKEHHWILHIRISLSTKFQRKQTI